MLPMSYYRTMDCCNQGVLSAPRCRPLGGLQRYKTQLGQVQTPIVHRIVTLEHSHHRVWGRSIELEGASSPEPGAEGPCH